MRNAQRVEADLDDAEGAEHHWRVDVAHMRDPERLAGQRADAGAQHHAAFRFTIFLQTRRAPVAIDANQAWVLWLREDANGQSLWLSRRSPDLATELQHLEVAKLQGRGRATGYPQIALRNGAAYIAWTDIVDGVSRLRGAIVSP